MDMRERERKRERERERERKGFELILQHVRCDSERKTPLCLDNDQTG